LASASGRPAIDPERSITSARPGRALCGVADWRVRRLDADQDLDGVVVAGLEPGARGVIRTVEDSDRCAFMVDFLLEVVGESILNAHKLTE